MLTPQEITEKKFDKVMVWGYDMNGVDSFLEAVEADYAQLYKENITLKSKMKVLVAKIDEYRKVDESMRKALLSAQSMATDIVERAKRESASREEAVEQEVSRKLSEMQERIVAEEQRLEEAKTSAQAFIERIMSMYAKEHELLTAIRDREFAGREVPRTAAVPQSAPAAPVYDDADDSLPDTVSLPSFDEPPVQPVRRREQEPAVRRREQDPSVRVRESDPHERYYTDDEDDETIVLTPKPRFEFNNLQFGEQYKPKK